MRYEILAVHKNGLSRVLSDDRHEAKRVFDNMKNGSSISGRVNVFVAMFESHPSGLREMLESATIESVGISMATHSHPEIRDLVARKKVETAQTK